MEETVKRALRTDADSFIFEKAKLGDSDTDFQALYNPSPSKFEFLRRWFCGGEEVEEVEEEMSEGEDGVEDEGEDMIERGKAEMQNGNLET